MQQSDKITFFKRGEIHSGNWVLCVCPLLFCKMFTKLTLTRNGFHYHPKKARLKANIPLGKICLYDEIAIADLNIILGNRINLMACQTFSYIQCLWTASGSSIMKEEGKTSAYLVSPTDAYILLSCPHSLALFLT